MIDLYAILGVARDATEKDIRRAYRNAAKKAHPDTGGSAEQMGQVALARDVLLNPERRGRYDRTGEADETVPDQFESSAMTVLMQAVSDVWTIAERRGMEVATVDVIGDAKRGLTRKIDEAEETSKKAKRDTKNARDFAARFKATKGCVNRISPMVEARAAEIERNVESMTNHIRILKRAFDILKDHEYDYTSAPTERARTHRAPSDFLIPGFR